MKKIIPYILFTCLSGITITNGFSVLAGGCNSHMNKNAKIECAEDDTECQKNRAEKYQLGKGSLS